MQAQTNNNPSAQKTQGILAKNATPAKGANLASGAGDIVRTRKAKAQYIDVCFHCGRTDGLLHFRQADGRTLTVCEVYARSRGMI